MSQGFWGGIGQIKSQSTEEMLRGPGPLWSSARTTSGLSPEPPRCYRGYIVVHMDTPVSFLCLGFPVSQVVKPSGISPMELMQPSMTSLFIAIRATVGTVPEVTAHELRMQHKTQECCSAGTYIRSQD